MLRASAKAPAERLGAQQDVDAEGATLPDEPVEQQGGFLGDLVVVDEELLELVDDQQDARHRADRRRWIVPRYPARSWTPAGAEDLAALLHLHIEPLEDAQAELPLALDGDHPGVREVVARVGLELDALLEVDQVELDLVGRVPQRRR